jgi:PAS domain S-box-containing protein
MKRAITDIISARALLMAGRPTRAQRVLVVGLGFLAYILAFAPLHRALGPPVGAFSVLPVVLAGALLGQRYGVAAGLILVPIHLGLYSVAGGTLRGIVPAALAFTFMGGVVGRLRDLGRVLEAQRLELHQSRVRSERNEERFRLLFDESPVPIFVFDPQAFRFLAVNEAALRLYGYERHEFLAVPPPDLKLSSDNPETAFGDQGPPGDVRVESVRHKRKDGSVIDVEITSRGVAFAGRKARLAVTKDMTEHKRLEEQFRQSQKMEAVGRLAGGVAHDFNNLLSVILTFSGTLAEDLKPGNPMLAELQEIQKAGNRAAGLTRQLLAFSRRQALEPRTLGLSDVVSGLDKMLRRLIGEDVELVTSSARGLGSIKADPGQIEQVLMNLVINARDAMPRGGRLSIETSNVELDEEYARDHLGVKPGPHVMLAVSDTGVGMDKETLARIFEPFFTTKEVGKGTGLGLATVFGIVEQSNGSIWVYSEPGKGTSFKIYFPRVERPAEPAREIAPSPASLRGSETILLVEDEEQVRNMVRGILRKNGYEVLDVQNGGEALLCCERHAGKIDLLLTDVVMPMMSGPALAQRLSCVRPDLKASARRARRRVPAHDSACGKQAHEWIDGSPCWSAEAGALVPAPRLALAHRFRSPTGPALRSHPPRHGFRPASPRRAEGGFERAVGERSSRPQWRGECLADHGCARRGGSDPSGLRAAGCAYARARFDTPPGRWRGAGNSWRPLTGWASKESSLRGLSEMGFRWRSCSGECASASRWVEEEETLGWASPS